MKFQTVSDMLTNVSNSREGAVDLWLGRDDTSYSRYIQIEEGALLSPDLEDEGVKARIDALDEDDGFHGYGDMISLIEDKGIAVVHVEGTMGEKESMWTRVFGIPTYQGISNALVAAALHDDVKGILIDWDSPGGPSKGVSGPTNTIKQLSASGIPIHSHTSGVMMSGAMWIASASERISASTDGEVGSIGVLAIHKDITKALEESGVKVTILRAGKYKALVNPYEKLSDTAKQLIDKKLSITYNNFIGEVASNRKLDEEFVRSNAAEGKEFTADEGKAVKLIDNVLSFDEAVNALSKRIERKNKADGAPSNFSGGFMAKKLGTEAVASIIEASGLTIEAAAAAMSARGMVDEPEQEVAGVVEEKEEEVKEEAVEVVSSKQEKAESPETTILAGMIKDLQGQVTSISVELSETKKGKEELEVAATGYRNLVVEGIGRLRVGLGRPGSVEDLDQASHLTVIAAHSQLVGEVMRVFPSSQVSAPRIEEGTKVETNYLKETLDKVTSFSRR
jgi:signal peptide peptidase SppA